MCLVRLQFELVVARGYGWVVVAGVINLTGETAVSIGGGLGVRGEGGMWQGSSMWLVRLQFQLVVAWGYRGVVVAGVINVRGAIAVWFGGGLEIQEGVVAGVVNVGGEIAV